MLNMDQAGVATAAVVITIIAVAGGTVGTPVAVDQMDVQPDSPLYGLEKAGEAIKEATFAGGQGWEIARGHERTSEFVNMADKGKATDHTYLLSEAEDRFKKAIESAGDVKGLQRAEEAINKHISTLENVREKALDVTKPWISLAISQSARCKSAVADVAAGKLPGKSLGSAEREEIRNRLGVVKQNVESLRNRVRENLEKAATKAEVAKIVQNIEFGTASELASKASEMADEGKGEYVQPLVEEAQDRFDAATGAAADRKGLERAIEATRKHLEILENVREKVPKPARDAIAGAMDRSSSCLRVLENLLEAGKAPTGEEMEERLENARAKRMERVEELQDKLERIIERFESKKENIGKKIEEISKSFEKKRERLEEKFENLEEKWGKAAESRIDKLENRLERKEDLLENLKDGLEKRLAGLEERKENLLDELEKKREDWLGGLENMRDELLENLERMERPKALLENLSPERFGLPENIVLTPPKPAWRDPEEWMENLRERIEMRFGERTGKIEERFKEKRKSLENSMRERMKKAREKFEDFKKRMENRMEALKFHIGENFKKTGENFEKKLKRIERKREEKIQKLEERLERLKEKFRERIEEIVERIRKLQPKGIEWPPENIWEDWLGERWPFNWSREMKPGENVIPFVHWPGKPPWACPPENLAFEVPENLEEEGYALMGVKLPDHPVTYSVNPSNGEGIPEDAVVREVREAFETWDANTARELFSDNVALTSASGFARDGVNAVSFAPLDRAAAAAETRVWYDESSGRITEFDVVFNTDRDFGVDPDGEGPETIEEFDLRAIATHEAGHALGLKDVYDADLSQMTMYYRSEPGSTIKISLESGDLKGLHALYGE